MDHWAVELLISVSGLIGTYAVLRSTVAEHTRNIDSIEKKIDAGVKRLDDVQDKVIVLERDTSRHIDLPTAEDRFVSKHELQLHLQNIELITKHTDKQVETLTGKLDDLTTLLRNNIVATLSGKENK